ncbi:MAG: autotransporter-associated beta strand repeat-containing protein [Cyclobacteriaceae bacterium]|nr:autotransporter-associated beta strand repeat-containing protein [Cyclobacteriaceae bacterium]
MLRASLAFFLLIFSISAFGQKTWLPATGGDWSVGANWSGGVAPIAGDIVIINTDQSGNITNVPTISLASLTISGDCLFGSTAAATVSTITVTGALTISNGKTLTTGIDGSGFRVNIILASTSISTIAGTLNVTSGTVNRFLQNDGDLTITSTGLVRDNFSVTGFDSDFVVGANATLRIGSVAGITTSPTATGNVQVTGVRTFPTTANYSYVGSANQSTGNGLPATVNNLTIANTGGGGNNTVSLTANVGISSTLFVNNGIFALGVNNVTTTGALNMTGTSITGSGTITLAGNITTNASGATASIGAPITLSGADRTLAVADGAADPDLQISSGINGGFGFIKSGTGLLNLFGASSYTGPTTVSAGTLRIGSATALGTVAGGTTVNSGAAIDINGQNYAAAEPLTLNGTGISGGGAIFNSSGSTAIFGGLITLASTSSISGTAGAINITNTGTITGAGFDLILDGLVGGTLTSNLGTGTGGLVKSGGGIWNLGGTNTFTGTVLIHAGTLRLLNSGAVNSSNAVLFGSGSTGIFQLNGNSITISGLNTNVVVGTPIIENAGGVPATLTVNTAGANTFAGVLQNGGQALLLVKNGAGSLALAGSNTYTGSTTLNTGTLAINSSTALGTGTLIINGGALDNTSGAFKALSNNNPQSWNGDFAFIGSDDLNLGTGAVTPNANRQVTINANNLVVPGIIGGGAITITKAGPGALTLSGNNTFTNGFVLNAGTLHINHANALGNASGTFTINSGTINNGTGAPITTANYPLAWNGDFAFTGTQSLNLGTGAVSISANRQVTVNANTLTVGGVINTPAIVLTKAGAGTLSFGSNNVTLSGLTVSAGSLTSTSSTLTLSGNFSNSGTFNHNSGTVIYSGGAPQLVAAVTYHNLITSAAGQKNAAGAITVNNNLTNSTILDMGANALTVSGTIDNTGGNLRFTGATNGLAVNTGTVTYYGASQTITAGVYNNLVINQASGQASLGGNVTVNGTLTLTNGVLNLSGFDLLLGPSATISVASPSATRMIIANGSKVIKTFAGVGSFLFPIGDNTGVTEYSPITVNVTAGAGFPANVGVSVVDAKHPNNSSGSNFLTRYWEVDQTGLAGCVATITANYPNADITGVEGSIASAQLTGTFNQVTNPWTKFSALASNTLSATGAILTSGQVNYFSGIGGANPTATIAGGGGTICVGGSAALTTNVTGDGPFTYSWSPAAGLSATTVSNPIASPIITTVYTVTVRDGNGITATDNTTITVNPVPTTPNVTPAGPVQVCEGSANVVLSSDAVSGNQWYKDGVAIGGATGTTLSIVTTPANSGSYTVISTVGGCASAVSNAVGVTINALPLASPVVSPATTTICNGSTVTVSISPSQAGVNYRLIDGFSPVSSYVAGTGGVINLVSTALTASTTLTVEAYNPITGCTTILTGTVVVTIGATIPTPVINPAGPVTSCVGDPAIVLTSSATSGNQWYKDGIPILGEVNQTLSISTAVANSGSYTVYEIQAGCTSAPAATVFVTINSIASPPVASNPNPICVGSIVPALSASGSNLRWYSDAGLTNLVGTGSPFTPGVSEVDIFTAGTYLLYVTQTIGCESPATTVSVVVNPAVVANAGTNTQLCFGQSITLGGSPTATGGSGTYTYSWSSVPPGFSSSQSNPVVTPALGSITYIVQVTDAFGCSDTGQVDVSVGEVPTFSLANTTGGGTGNICSGSTISIGLSSPTAGATITLQPVSYGPFITGGLYAAGGSFVNGSTVTEGGGLTNTSNAPVILTYTFSVSTPDCTNPLTQQTTITVNPTPAMAIVNGNPSICSNANVNIQLNSATAGAIIRLTSVNYASVSGSLVAGATFTPGATINESLTNSGLIPVTVRYNFQVEANGCITAGYFADVDVNPNPTFVVSNFAPEICNGDQTSIFFGSAVLGHQINVVSVNYGGVTGGTVIPGTTTFSSGTPLQEFLFNTTNAPIDILYEFNVTTPATTPVCPTTPVNQYASVRVYPAPMFSTTNNSGGGTGTICTGQQASILLNTPVAGGQIRLLNVSYGAVSGSFAPGAIFTNGQSLVETLTNTTGSPVNVTYEFESFVYTCSPGPSQVVVVTVNPAPNVVALPASQTICSGSNTNIALSTTNGVGGATYSWTVVQSGVTGATASSGATINQTLTATGATAGTATYTITPTAGGCNGTPITVIVTVNPLPDVVAAPNAETVCSGATTSINLSTSNGVAGATYSWTVVQSNVSGATAGFGSSINQTLTATTSSSGTATYTITPSAAGCNGTPIVVVVTVNPAPNVVALPAAATICSGASTNIALSTTNGVGGATYSWTVVQSGVTGATASSGATINQTLTATGATAGTATYTITPSAGGCNGTPITVIVTVNPLPDVVAAPNAETICSGATTSINLSTSNGVAGATYSWTVVQSNVSGATAGFGTAINQTLTATTSSSGTATYTITPSAAGCNGTPIVVVVTVNPAPNVVALPASQTICSGSNTNIALSTTNGVGGATYSWTVVQSGVTGATASSGATISQTLTATGATAGTATYTITPTAGGCNGTPITVIVTVNPLPDVVAAPNAETICSGATTSINLSTSNGVAGATYSWTVVQSNVSGATAGFGTSINQTLTATTSSSGTATYTITPSAAGCNGTPIVVVVTVNPAPNVVALPAAATICSGASTNIALSTTNGVGGATYSWTVVQSGVSGASASSGATINQTLTATGATAGTATYTITPSAGGCNGTPITVIVTVNPLPDVVAAPNAETICSGASTNIALSTSNGVAGATYSWTVVQSNVSGATAGFGTSINQTLTATTSSSGTATYTITPSAAGCAGTPIVVVVTVNPTPNVVALPASQTICSGSNTNIALSTTNGVGGATYSWTVVQSGVTGATASSGATINQTLTATGATAGTATYTITPSAGGCNGTPITVIVTVNPLPDVVAAPNAETVCSGATTSINLSTSNGVAGATYSWTVVQSNVSGATAGFGSSINQTLTATTSSSGTATYTITPSANGCAGTPIVVVVTVNPTPNVVALPASQTICSGSNTNIALSTTNGVGGATYSWTVVQSGVSGASASSGATINQTLTATGATAGTATYTITPTAGGCNGTPITVIVTINPLPDVVAAPNAETICSGATTSINLSTSNGVAGATYSWTVVQSNVSGATAGFGTSINQTLTATTSSSGTATYTITPSAAGCAGTPIVVAVTVNPASLTTSSPLSVTRCSGAGALNFTPAFNVAGTTYTWTSAISGPVTPASVTASGSSTISDNPINTGSTTGTVTYTFVPTAPGGCVGATFHYVVTVNPEPVGVNDAKTVCSDEAIGYNLLLNVATLGNNVGSTFTWIAIDNPNPLVTGETLTSQTGPTITDVITNKTNTNQVVNYTVVPTSTNGCVGASFQISITVKPEPVGISATAPAICSESIVGYNLQTNVNTLGNNLPANFTWSAVPNANVSGETTALRSSSVIDDVLVNTTGVNQTVIYQVTPTSQVGGCVGDPFTIQVNVNPKAIFSAGPNLAVCTSENDIEIQGLVTFTPAPYTWAGGTFNDNTLERPRYILSAADKAVVVPTVRVLTLTIPASGVCPAESKTMNLTINPLPNANFLGIPPSGQHPENGPVLELNAFQTGGLFTIIPGSGLSGTSVNGSTGFDYANLTPNLATLYDGTPASVNQISYTYTDGNGCTNTNTQNLIINPLTVVDFTVQNASTDGDGDFRICADSGNVLLIPLDGGNPGQPPTLFESLTTGLTLTQIGSQYYIPTNNLTSGVYTIQFTYTNVANVTSYRVRNVKVQASPVAAFISTGSCIDAPTVFMNNTVINTSNVNTPAPPVISLLEWNFGDFSTAGGPPAGIIPGGTNGGKTTGTYNNPSHTYGAASSYTVSLRATTSQGCSNTFVSSTPIIVGTIPVVNFDYFAICNNDSTRFKAVISNLGSSTITQYNWNFGDGDIVSGVGSISPPANSGRTIGTYSDPIHKYVSTGMYNPSLTVTTNLGCTSAPKTRPVNIVPYVTVIASASSIPEDFATPAGWFIENLIDPDDNSLVSWKHGAPTGIEINASNSAGNVWWTGNNANTYFAGEKSVVNSPCFDIDVLKRPMISLDYYSDAETNLDGAVLQYSINGGSTWEIVGPLVTETRNQGINWFNGQGIPSNPGNQLVGQYGWTGKQGGWKNARFNLDRIDSTGNERKQVRFRIAFASNQTNDPNLTFDGFAFDNVFVGEKQRKVLVEQFTTSNLVISVAADNYLNGLYQTQITNRGGFSDFDQIQYHVNFNGVDQLNRDNPIDPAARALRYRISQPPYTLMDGLLEPGKFTGNYNEITQIEIDRRALSEPVFDLQLTDIPTTDNTRISTRLTLTARQDYNQPVLINVALLEKDINGVNKNVLRKNLFSSAGEVIGNTWTKGQQVDKDALNVLIDVPITNPNGLMLIGYVQDLNTNEILQSVVERNAPVKIGSPIVGVDDHPAFVALKAIDIYPNPASLEFNFGLPADVQAGSTWKILDQRGIAVLQGDFTGAVNGIKTVSVSDLANAVYYIVMTSPQGAVVHRKLVVVNRN